LVYQEVLVSQDPVDLLVNRVNQVNGVVLDLLEDLDQEDLLDLQEREADQVPQELLDCQVVLDQVALLVNWDLQEKVV